MRSEGSPHFYKARAALLYSAAPHGSASYRNPIRNLWNVWNVLRMLELRAGFSGRAVKAGL